MLTKWLFTYFILAGTPVEPIVCPSTACSAYSIVDDKAACEHLIEHARDTQRGTPVQIIAACVEIGAGVTVLRRELTGEERARALLAKEEGVRS